MSTDEKEKQVEHRFKKIENYGIRITVLQILTIVGFLAAGFEWYQNRNDKSIIDGSTLNNKIDNVFVYIKNKDVRDSIVRKQQIFIDSVSLSNKFNDQKRDIIKTIDQKLISTDARLNNLENKYKTGWMIEHKNTPNSMPTAQTKN